MVELYSSNACEPSTLIASVPIFSNVVLASTATVSWHTLTAPCQRLKHNRSAVTANSTRWRRGAITNNCALDGQCSGLGLAALPDGLFDRGKFLQSLYVDRNDVSLLQIFRQQPTEHTALWNIRSSQLLDLFVSKQYIAMMSHCCRYLYNNQLSTLPSGIFDRLTSLSQL